MPEQCFLGWSNAGGVNAQGRCCCNCVHQRPVVGHPWNKPPLQSSITDVIGYGCTVPDMPAIVVYDKQHSLCEMHEFTK